MWGAAPKTIIINGHDSFLPVVRFPYNEGGSLRKVDPGSFFGIGAVRITNWCEWDLNSLCIGIVQLAAVAMVDPRVLSLGVVPGTDTMLPCCAANECYYVRVDLIHASPMKISLGECRSIIIMLGR